MHSFVGHAGCGVWSVDFSKDGKWLVSGGFDNNVIVWALNGAAAPTVLRTLSGHTDWVRCVKLSPDGLKIASASDDGTAAIWDAESGQRLLVLRGHGGPCVICVGWSPDGKRVASGGVDKLIVIWDAATGTQIMKLQGHSAVVTCVLFGAETSILVSASYDGTIVVWGLGEGGEATVKRTLRGHTGAVTSISLSPHGTYMASASDDKSVRLWEVATGQQGRVLKGHTGWVRSVTWSRDGKHIVSGGEDKSVRLWEADVKVCAHQYLVHI